jgi:hypothetical protein
VPVEFLTDEQAAAYGAFGEVPTRPELERFFFLDDDRDLIALRRSDGHRLGMAVQICTVRYIGTFLENDPLAVALFNHAVTWLRRNRVLLPGVSVLARQVSEARTVAERRLYESVARAAQKADRTLAPALVGLLEVSEGKRVSELERLRTPPTKSTGTAMARAMERVEEISAFALGRVNLSRVPVNRLNILAR